MTILPSNSGYLELSISSIKDFLVASVEFKKLYYYPEAMAILPAS